jgi:N-[(2S)-2-amino-2-carboxyethyl]-L-glutamate dehydrogenase
LGKFIEGTKVASRGILILTSDEVDAILSNRELQLLEIVKEAYLTHRAGESSLPNSLFLRFPNGDGNRIIALPAYLGSDFDVAGMKWVSSFPRNINSGLNRASAVVILNSPLTGQPLALIEGSIISAKRTAASAALAARTLHGDSSPTTIGFIGCGPINFEVARFVLAVWPDVKEFVVFDIDPARAEQFGAKCRGLSERLEVSSVRETSGVLSDASVVSIATNTSEPHIHSLSMCPPGATILHVSLRDLSPEVILAYDNIVDDVEHVCRAQTSVHLGEQLTGNRDFIRGTLADVLEGAAAPRRAPEGITIFSPFGLGVLDLALSKLVYESSFQENYGVVIDSFLPGAYLEAQ